MAVPGRRRIVHQQEEAEPDSNSDAPPHLRHLDAALGSGDADALRHALDNLAGSIDEPIENGDTALHLACVYGYLTCVQILLERGASLEAKDEDGEIPLHGACAAGYADIVQLLLNKGNDMDIMKRMIESVDEEGDTPLHHAARAGHVNVILLLLANGASPTTKNYRGQIPSELS